MGRTPLSDKEKEQNAIRRREEIAQRSFKNDEESFRESSKIAYNALNTIASLWKSYLLLVNLRPSGRQQKLIGEWFSQAIKNRYDAAKYHDVFFSSINTLSRLCSKYAEQDNIIGILYGQTPSLINMVFSSAHEDALRYRTTCINMDSINKKWDQHMTMFNNEYAIWTKQWAEGGSLFGTPFNPELFVPDNELSDEGKLLLKNIVDLYFKLDDIGNPSMAGLYEEIHLKSILRAYMNAYVSLLPTITFTKETPLTNFFGLPFASATN